MPLALPGLNEPTFFQLSQRAHRRLKPYLNACTLGQFREALSQALGYRSVHDARQIWARSTPLATTSVTVGMTPSIETYDRLHKCPVILSDLARGCSYQGYEFGAHYLDSVCIDGFLWDADSGGPGEGLSSGGDVPCPWCNHAAWVTGCLEELKDQGFNAQSEGEPFEANPHPQATRFHHLADAFTQAWAAGWREAAALDLVSHPTQ